MDPIGCISFKCEASAENLANFERVRDEAEDLRTQGLSHQFWGQAIQTPRPFYWYLLWDPAKAESLKAKLNTLAGRLATLLVLAEAPQVFVVHMPFSALACLRAPIVANVAIVVTPENAKSAQVKIGRALELQDKLAPRGFTKGPMSAIVGGEYALYLGGWESVEAHEAELAVEGEAGDVLREAAAEAWDMFGGMAFFHIPFKEHTRAV